MESKYFILFFTIAITQISVNNACSMDGVSNWLLPVTESIIDTYEGVIFRRATSNIIGINTVMYSEGLNAGPYINVSYESSLFTIETNDLYPRYENLETEDSMGVTVVFTCSGGSQSTLVFRININDTNNNEPTFIPNENYRFKIAPPVPPGFVITDCINDIIVRDIDLTTEMIVFEIDDNPYFEITYNGTTAPKEFKAMLTTSVFIRRLPEPITIRISATDVDRTNDPPRTTYGTLQIEADTEFEFPDDLIFSNTFYLAQYTDDHRVVLQNEIYLEQGYDDNVIFSLEGENEDSFEVVLNGNSVELNVNSPLDIGPLAERQIYMIVRAEREHTSGATATIIINIPARNLAFTSVTYSGFLINGNVELGPIELNIGNVDDITFTLTGEYATYFELDYIENQINIVALSELPSNIIQENNFIILNVIANSSNIIEASTTVVLDIVKTDTITPIFSKNIYYGTYSLTSLLAIDNVTLIQGHNEDVTFHLAGDHAQYFIISQEENNISINVRTSIPRELIYDEKVLTFNIIAEKPFTVGGNAAVSINFPRELTEPRAITFSNRTYFGEIDTTDLFVSTILLDEGFQPDIELFLFGDNSEWFVLTTEDNVATLEVIASLPPEILQTNRQLIFTVSAEIFNDETIARSAIIISLIKEEISKPVLSFEETHYIGTIDNNTLVLENLFLVDDFSEEIVFSLHGEWSTYFNGTSEGKTVTITMLDPIPEELLPENGIITLDLQASSQQAVSALTVIFLQILRDNTFDTTALLQFSETYYIGVYDDMGDLEFKQNIELVQGYDDSVVFSLHGDSSEWFELIIFDDEIIIAVNGFIPPAVINNNTQLIFEINANKPNTPIGAKATIIIIISQNDEENSKPLLSFEETHYIGTIDNNALALETIFLVDDFSEDIIYSLHGELSTYFNTTSDGKVVTITIPDGIPEEVLPRNGIITLELQASSPQTLSASTVIVLQVLRDDIVDSTSVLQFSKTYYVGVYNDMDDLEFNNYIRLDQGYDDDVVFSLHGDNSKWFELVIFDEGILVAINDSIPLDVIANNKQLIFEINANKPKNPIAAKATIIIVISRLDEENNKPILRFEDTHYIGTIDNNALQLETIFLVDDFSEEISFSLNGELSTYFTKTSDGNGVTIAIPDGIPEEVLPRNGIITLELQASSPQTMSAFTVIVLQVLRDDIVDSTSVLQFSETYYVGVYNDMDDLDFNNYIRLSQGYDDDVIFSLHGDNSKWFELVIFDEGVLVAINDTIPTDVIANNKQLIFEINANKPSNPIVARATIIIVISRLDEENNKRILRFEDTHYIGTIDNNTLELETIFLVDDFSEDISFSLYGELSTYFTKTSDRNGVTIAIPDGIPVEVLPRNGIITLELQASSSQTMSAFTVIVLQVLRDDIVDSTSVLQFSETYYVGVYNDMDDLDFNNYIRLSQGYDDSVVFSLRGDGSEWFELLIFDEGITVAIKESIPSTVIANNKQLIFEINANTPRNPITASAAIIIVISRVHEENNKLILTFEDTHYIGTIDNNTLELETISLIDDYSEEVLFSLSGDLSTYFDKISDGKTVTIVIPDPIPEELLPKNRIITLELQASSSQALSGFTVIVLKVLQDEIFDSTRLLQFSETYYIGAYNEMGEVEFDNHIKLDQGYDENVVYTLVGDNSVWFEVIILDERVTVEINGSIPPAVIANNRQLIFEINANKPTSPITAKAAILIIISQTHENNTIVLGFQWTYYVGYLNNGAVDLEPILLVEGYSPNVTFLLNGDYSHYFVIVVDGPTVKVGLDGQLTEEILSDNQVIVLELTASAPEALSSSTIIVLEIKKQFSDSDRVTLDKTYYTGVYNRTEEYLSFGDIITLGEGSPQDVEFDLEGDHSVWFALDPADNGYVIILISPIPLAVLSESWQLIFVVTANSTSSIARSTIVISLPNDTGDTNVSFDKLLYNGTWSEGSVYHERIFVYGYNGTTIEIYGDYAGSFTVEINAGDLIIQLIHSAILPIERSHVVLELRVPGAGAVLILDVIQPEPPVLPLVQFSSETYIMQVDKLQTGIIGEVTATADNGEVIVYSLHIDEDELQDILSVSNAGQVELSSPLDSGVYSFRVVATTVYTRVNNTALVILIVEEATCPVKDGVPPLIVMDRDEESPHENLVTLNRTAHENCLYTMINHWPVNQTWLYVDDRGLHANSIDREHESIAFMALSQIQVELILYCESDVPSSRIRRSLNTNVKSNPLGPYDYGPRNWLLTDTISYNPRRSFVNLIVNDINDNSPIFIQKDNEPIVVGYPLRELVDAVSPQALVQLKATDADIGENAALLYWSSDPTLAVSPSTGYVHVRNNAELENGERFTISATDRNGAGRTGSIDIMVRLLQMDNIAVITIKGALLEDQETVLASLSQVLGYEVKTLRSVVIPENQESSNSEVARRKVRQIDAGNEAQLQLYIYGLIDREPVTVTRLTTDINNNISTADITTLSLQDHLKNISIRIVPGRDTGLLAATIALSVLLFIIIVALGVWLFLKWRNERKYEEFSDENSLASREQIPQPPKAEGTDRPRLNLEEVKRSEKRLQDMLDIPEDKPDYDETKQEEAGPSETIINVTPQQRMPTVIQSIDKLKDATEGSDDDDEFGEIKKPRRKSVVTFNENVEKIIHLDDSQSDTEYEVYKF